MGGLSETKMNCKLPLMAGAIFVASALSASVSVQAQESRGREAEGAVREVVEIEVGDVVSG